MEEERRNIRGPALGLVIVVALMGALLFSMAVFHTYHFAFYKAVTPFLMSVVAWTVAAKLYSAWRYLDKE